MGSISTDTFVRILTAIMLHINVSKVNSKQFCKIIYRAWWFLQPPNIRIPLDRKCSGQNIPARCNAYTTQRTFNCWWCHADAVLDACVVAKTTPKKPSTADDAGCREKANMAAEHHSMSLHRAIASSLFHLPQLSVFASVCVALMPVQHQHSYSMTVCEIDFNTESAVPMTTLFNSITSRPIVPYAGNLWYPDVFVSMRKCCCYRYTYNTYIRIYTVRCLRSTRECAVRVIYWFWWLYKCTCTRPLPPPSSVLMRIYGQEIFTALMCII